MGMTTPPYNDALPTRAGVLAGFGERLLPPTVTITCYLPLPVAVDWLLESGGNS